MANTVLYYRDHLSCLDTLVHRERRSWKSTITAGACTTLVRAYTALYHCSAVYQKYHVAIALTSCALFVYSAIKYLLKNVNRA
jgi:hypothetical protein